MKQNKFKKLVTTNHRRALPTGVQMAMMDQSKDFFQKPVAWEYDFYLTGPVEGAERYVEWFDTIRNASPNDMINIHINSPGGDYYTAVQFRRVLQETHANVACSIEGMCHSAATFIFLSGNMFSISEGSSMLIHDYSSFGGYQKGSEQFRQIVHEKSTIDYMAARVYEDFLTEDEIIAMTEGQDIWLDEEEISERIDALVKLRQAEQDERRKAKGECDCEDCCAADADEEEVEVVEEEPTPVEPPKPRGRPRKAAK